MKHRSIRDSTIALETCRRVYVGSFSNAPFGRNLRRMPRITPSQVRVLEDFHPYTEVYIHSEFSPPDQASTDSSFESSGSAFYFTARSAFSEPTEEYQQTILQVLDTESGVLFDKVYQGSKGTLKGEQLEADILDEQHAVTVKLESPGRLRRNLATDNLVGMVTPPIPSLVLTLPTPQLPASPIFIPQSPITVSKFITAAADPPSSAHPPRQPSCPVPAMQFCSDCALVPPDSGLLCYSCDQQWLACKVWYQANDGGRRQRLTEPHIRPAESNAANRALMDFLRAPTGSGNSYGLGIRATPEGISRSRFRKLAPLLAKFTAESSLSVIYREEVLPLARRLRFVVDLRTLAAIPRKLWAAITDILSYNLQLLRHILDTLAELNLRVECDVPSVSEYLWMVTEDSVDDTRLLERAAQSASRFPLRTNRVVRSAHMVLTL
ncbi:uncharacterized protein B0H18DRAFT_996284 [Fomitopsis serialis]|uniref:uncharacterized protein n=1 Tax=Fomitopsis serialis TaxID=139415 RepID=UPI00200849C4|nr:uncharacterized protein B0H18DRAFT_996284 [Neoantrodia serialis]KAH9929790.1 hypothetical protein B0H18DRAFT_996284 [Neoantrodia serialis]